MLKPLVELIEEDGSDGRWFEAKVTWTGAELDRPCTYGIVLPRELAERFARAVRAGVAFGPAKVVTDVHGGTYVQANCLVSGRRANADLRRLGF